LYETRTGCGNASDEDAKPKRSVSKKSGGIKVRATEANEGWHESQRYIVSKNSGFVISSFFDVFDVGLAFMLALGRDASANAGNGSCSSGKRGRHQARLA